MCIKIEWYTGKDNSSKVQDHPMDKNQSEPLIFITGISNIAIYSSTNQSKL